MKAKIFTILSLMLLSFDAKSQLGIAKETFTRADTLRGMLTPLRTCYDINYYHLDVKINLDDKKKRCYTYLPLYL